MKKQISMLLALLFCISLSFIGCSNEPINILPTNSGKISVNASGAFIIDGDNKLWAYGSNICNELGLGWDVYKTGDPMLVMEDVVKVSSCNGVSFSLALKSDGTVWQWGPNKGMSNNFTDPMEYHGSEEALPKQVFQDAKDIVVTAEGAMAVKTNGEVWAWGSDIFGFIPDETKLCKNKEPYLIMKNGKYVYTCYKSFAVVTKNGDLYCWGDIFGDFQYTPKKVISDVKQVDFAYTTYVLKQDNSIWGFGSNYAGQLGNGEDTKGDSASKEVLVKKPIKIADAVKSFATVGGTLFYIKEDNTLWGCGSNRSGQLGNGVEGYQESRLENKPILIENGVSNIYSSDPDTLFYTKDNALWACGSNHSGLLGVGAEYDPDAEFGSCMISTPQKVLDGDVVDLYVSNNARVICILADGSMLRWGSDPIFFFYGVNGTETLPKDYAYLASLYSSAGGSSFSRSASQRAFFNTPQKITLPEGFTARTE